MGQARESRQEARCERCRWWEPHVTVGPQLNGWCKRLSPVASGGFGSTTARWPLTWPSHWCGDYEAALEGG